MKLSKFFLLFTIIACLYIPKAYSTGKQDKKKKIKRRYSIKIASKKIKLKNPYKTLRKGYMSLKDILEFKKLLTAAKENNIKKVKKLLARGAKQSHDLHKVTPILLACIKNHQHMVTLLIKNGGKKTIDTFSRNHHITPLLKTCENNNITIFKKLLPFCNKTINLMDKKKHSPLYYACRKKNRIICKKLLLNGAKVKKKNIRTSKLLKKYIRLAKSFDDAKNNKKKFEIIKKIKNKYQFRFLLKLAFSRFLQKIEHKNYFYNSNNFFLELLQNPRYTTEIEKIIQRYKKYISRKDMRKTARKFLKQEKTILLGKKISKLRKSKKLQNTHINPDIFIMCKNY